MLPLSRKARHRAVLAVVMVALACTPASDSNEATSAQMRDEETTVIAQLVGQVMAGIPPEAVDVPELRSEWGPVYAAARSEGERVGSDWADAASTGEALVTAVETAAEQAGDRDVDAVELCFAHSEEPVDLASDLLTNVHRGVLGLELRTDDNTARYSPTHMIALNYDFADVQELFARANDIPLDALEEQAAASVFSCEQVLVELGEEAQATPMFRGNEIIDLDAVTIESTRRSRELMATWMTASVQDDGRMTYKYWPSPNEESTANNTIRQWMATIALGRIADDAAGHELTARNIDYNLRAFFRVYDGLGGIEYDGSVKLGAVALAALAITEHPERDRWSEQYAALLRTVDHLWNEDGSFTTFLIPEGRNDNQNFYPGEALLLWAFTYAETEDPELLDRFMKSFQYYRDWHLDPANRNPAFVPWHTQAYYKVWQETRDPELAAFVFEMNDWLLSLQQWDDVAYPDLRGRFYTPDHPYGPPHASATGVYLEGLADAHALAVELGENERAEAYQLTIRRGLRSVLQLQFVDDVDLYYVREPERALGGLRTTEYDNEIRVDNVQHNLLALLKLLSEWSPEEFGASSSS